MTNGLDIAAPQAEEPASLKSSTWPTVRRAFFALVLSFVTFVLTVIVYRLPAPIRAYVTLSLAAGALVVGGLFTLIVVIPVVDLKSDIKTEFYSARAAYLCVIAGLVLFVIITIGVVFARVAVTLGKS